MASTSIAVALLQLFFYILVFAGIVLLVRKKGYRGKLNWLPVCIPALFLCVLRLTASALELHSMSETGTMKAGLLKSAAILDTVGVTPLLLTLVGLIKRANQGLKVGFKPWNFIPLQFSAVIATILASAGGREVFSGVNTGSGSHLMRGGFFVLIVIFLATLVLSIMTWLQARREGFRAEVERQAMVWLFICIPAVVVRFTYSLLFLFWTKDKTFYPISEDNTAIGLHFIMSTLMESYVVLIVMGYALMVEEYWMISG